MTVSKSRVQRLYDACVESFVHDKNGKQQNDYVPSASKISSLSSILDEITAEDLGIDLAAIEVEGAFKRRKEVRRKSKNGNGSPPPITYVHIDSCESFQIGVFCIPAGGVIPLHDHPGMTVLSKLLYGSMHVASLDIIKTNSQPYTYLSQTFNLRPAKLRGKGILRGGTPTSVLYPDKGNIHSFTAITASAVLDVLVPPYNGDPTYYKLCSHPQHIQSVSSLLGKRKDVEKQKQCKDEEKQKQCKDEGESVNGIVEDFTDDMQVDVLLKEVKVPKELKIETMEYSGPPFIRRSS